jgi:hypothetical protein
MNNRTSPTKQQRMKNSNSMSVPNPNRTRSNTSMGSSYSRNYNSYHRNYSHTNSPTAMSASSLPAVPLFYTNTYADPPECSSLPKPPEAWYLKSHDENISIKIEEEKKEVSVPIKQKIPQRSYYKNNNQGFYSPFYSTRTNEKFQTPYISVKA